MDPFTILHLFKKIITRDGGVIAEYGLRKNFTIPVMVVPREPTPEELEKIKAIFQ